MTTSYTSLSTISISQSRMACDGAACEMCARSDLNGLGCGADSSPLRTLFVGNAFSLQMLDGGDFTSVLEKILVVQLSDQQAKDLLTAAPNLDYPYQIVSAVGHADTAAVMSGILGTEVPANRISVRLRSEDALLVGQYSGPRLPEGAKTLPEGARIKWYLVRLEETDWKEFRGASWGDEEGRFPNCTHYPKGEGPVRPFSEGQLKGLLKRQ